MAFRALAGPLALAVALGGLPPCVGMDMSGGAAAVHECCGAEECAASSGRSGAPSHDPAPAPDEDCCALGAPAESRSPVDRAAASVAVGLNPVETPSALTARAAVLVERVGSSPPRPSGIPRHVLFSLYLI
jgi:hypothetical protein